MSDVHAAVTRYDCPLVEHEIGQRKYYPDFGEAKKWAAVMALKNFEIVRDDLDEKHLLALHPEFVAASGKLATLLYKEEIKQLLINANFGTTPANGNPYGTSVGSSGGVNYFISIYFSNGTTPATAGRTVYRFNAATGLTQLSSQP